MSGYSLLGKPRDGLLPHVLHTCSLSTFPELFCFPPPPTAGANIVCVEGGVAATGELTVSFSAELSAQEVPAKVLLLTEEVGGAEEIEEGTDAVCWGPRREKR